MYIENVIIKIVRRGGMKRGSFLKKNKNNIKNKIIID